MQKKIFSGIYRLVRYYCSYPENHNPEQAETEKFGISAAKTLITTEFTKMQKKYISWNFPVNLVFLR